MKQKILSFFRDYHQKLILILLLIPLVVLVDQMEFPKIDAFIRDALQYLNSGDGVSREIVTVNVDTSAYSSKPFSNDYVFTLINKIQSSSPKSILLLMEPSEFSTNQKSRTDLYTFLENQKNLYLEKQTNTLSFFEDSLFKKFPRYIIIPMGLDESFGAKDGKHRRAILKYDNRGRDNIFNVLNTLGLSYVPLENYHFTYKFWDTTQVFLKNFKLGTFGNYEASEILSTSSNLSGIFRNKVVIIGSFDEFSYLATPSVFDLFGKTTKSSFSTNNFPYQDSVANLLNLYTTGDYIRYLSFPYSIYALGLLLCLLIISNLRPKQKLFIFLMLLPSIAIGTILLYIFGSFYVNLSQELALLILLQYFGIPIVMFFIFQQQEKLKLEDINAARIESLLTISEKVAHDIRSPLSAINLIMSKVNFDNPEYKEILQSALKRIDESAGKILVKYKTQGANEESLEKVNFSLLLENLVSEKKLLDPRIEYKIEYDHNTYLVYAHRSELERILSNVIDNSIDALKAVSIFPKITLCLKREDTHISLEILDNGIGIENEVLNLLGHRKISTKSSSKGNGIGLLHARSSVLKMHGTLAIKSTTGMFTAVTIRLKTAL